MKETKILVIGACGQIGTELVLALREKYGTRNVVAADIQPDSELPLDVLNKRQLNYTVKRLGITQVYHLAAVLSASGEKDPLQAWDINMRGLLNVLEVCRIRKIERVFWPSSIAVFGHNSFRSFCSQHCYQDPATIYGISKTAGEYWCQYYFERYGLDVRSIRYPGLISYKAKAGGGTTDYAVDIFHQAIESGTYDCFLSEHTMLPMMYMPDAVRATLELMEVNEVAVRTSYNLSAFSFTPGQLAAAIAKHIPLKVRYAPDFRQAIADSWPTSIDDHHARRDWNWKEEFTLETMAEDMLANLTELKLVKV